MYNFKKNRQNFSMTFSLVCRSLIIYLLVLLLLRFMGKRQIGDMQPFELVITLIIADLATIPMSELTLPIIQGVIPLLTLVCIHYFICLLSRKSIFFRKLFNGNPIVLITPNGIDYSALKKANMNFNDLVECLRDEGYFQLDEILYAILQNNGTISVLNRSQYNPATPSDLKIETNPATLPIILVNEGKLLKDNLKLCNIDKNFILDNVKVSSLKEILFLSIDQEGKMYYQPYNKPFQTIKTSFKGDKW